MNKHTPGPWRIKLNTVNIVEAGDTVIAWADCSLWSSPTPKPDVMEANAHLIAAAPELLEALEGLVDAVSNGEAVSGAEAVGFARTIIAKAKGTE